SAAARKIEASPQLESYRVWLRGRQTLAQGQPSNLDLFDRNPSLRSEAVLRAPAPAASEELKRRLHARSPSTQQEVSSCLCPRRSRSSLNWERRAACWISKCLSIISKTNARARRFPAFPVRWPRPMVRDGLLTPFQAQLLLQGKWRGFIIADKYRL